MSHAVRCPQLVCLTASSYVVLARVGPVPDGAHGRPTYAEVLVAALTNPPFSMKPLTAFTFSADSVGGLPPVLPSAAARSTLALIRSRRCPVPTQPGRAACGA